MNEQPPVKRQHGCLFYGCIAGAVCLVAILVAFLLGLHMVKKALNQFTDTKPMPLPVVQMSQAQIDEVQKRFDAFTDAVGAGRSTPSLELTSDEINALIANRPGLSAAKGKLYLTVQDGRLQAQISLPMDQVGLPMLKGRYLNGTSTFAVSLQNGILFVTPVEILVKGKPLPGVYMDKMRQQNFATGINNDSQASVALNRLQSIEVTDGKLILVPKEQK
jgi:hypothetical protein